MHQMSRFRIPTLILLLIVVVCFSPTDTEAESGPVGTYLAPDVVAVYEYWTPERMQEAQPVPMPLAVYDENTLSHQDTSRLTPDAFPGYAPGWSPGSGLQPSADAAIQITKEHALWPVATSASWDTEPQHGSPPTSPETGPYPPFQRWTWYGNYLAYPTSTIGKLFFTLDGSNFVCSASAIQKNTIALAGHCVSTGNGTFLSSALFCPSFCGAACSFGPHPARGCWAATFVATTFQWHNSGATDRDIACLVLATTGDTVADNVGDVTGWAGRSWNWDPSQPIFAAGYPAGPPFAGYHLISAFSSEWYTVNMTSGDGQVSKYIGNDMTGGSSGGPWWLNIAHRTAEYADTDGLGATDPGQNNSFPWINGVNSHKRCNQAGCPSGSVFTQEMGSPEFTKTSGDSNESEDVFDICFSNGGV